MNSREPTLIDLANFFEDEMTLVNDPRYSRKTVSQYLEKGPTRKRHRGDRRKFHAMTTKTDNSSKDLQKGNKASSGRTCPVCGERHDIEDCKYYLQQTLEERSKLVFKKKLCYGCFQEIKKDHNAKIVVREDFVKCAMGNIQLHSMAISERKLTVLNITVTVMQVRREKMVKQQHVHH